MAVAAAEPPVLPPIQWAVAGIAVAALALGAVAQGWRLGALFAIGGLLGMSLYHAAFGFSSAWRRAFLDRDFSGVMAQLVMLAVAMVLFAPMLAEGEVLGRRVAGAVAPVGVQVMVGSFMFGLGMQLGGGCGSGTLYTVGGGSVRMVVTLVAFCAGGFWASIHMPWWASTPRWGAISLAAELGWPLALAVQLAILAVAAMALRKWRRGETPLWGAGLDWRMLTRGPWPLVLSALLLAVLNGATVVISGHPWSITWGFTLWAAKAAQAVGWDPATAPFWTGRFTATALSRGLWHDVTSVMNVGIILGALMAAGLAGRFSPALRIPAKSLLAAVVGGLAMGYGARIAFGCNIGAFFSGVASTSLHGWLWIVFAVAGTGLGVRLRRLFGLAR